MDIVGFFEKVTGFSPFKYQIKFLKDKSNKIAIKAGRKVGKTTMVAILALYNALYFPKQEILCVAPVMRQSRDILFAQIEMLIRTNRDIRERVRKLSRGMDMAVVRFDNGSRIIALPAGSTSYRIRGFTPNMIIADEAAFIPEDAWNVLDKSLFGIRGRIILISTPNRNTGRFFDAFKEDSKFSTYHIPCKKCPRITKQELEDAKKISTYVEYQRDVEGEFAEMGNTFFPVSLVDKCIGKYNETDEPESGKIYRLAVDFARMGEDETVYMIGEILGNDIKVVKMIATQKTPSTDILIKIRVLHKFFNFESIKLDVSGIGGAIYDVLSKEGLPVVSCPFHLQAKYQYYRNLKILMENDKIKYPDNQKLITQLKELEFEYREWGAGITLKLSAPKGKGKHDDYTDALALLCIGISLIMEEEMPEFYIRSG